MFNLTRGHIAIFLLLIASLLTYIISASATHVISEEKNTSKKEVPTLSNNKKIDKSIYINLSDMKVRLIDGDTVAETLSIVSKGRPGSYYETPGGIYKSDYKEEIHFSSIGHVYMPWSVHIFGNFFIHGIPYHEDGTRVSSTYSGGCIRLEDEDAKKIYKFIEKGTRITIKQNNEENFAMNVVQSEKMKSQNMTNYMSAIISLEFLTQDDEIYFNNGTTTRKKLLNDLVNKGDTSVSNFYASSYGDNLFIERMNEKAESIGLNNTHFTSATESAETTANDYNNFLIYIKNYKSYLLNIKSN